MAPGPGLPRALLKQRQPLSSAAASLSAGDRARGDGIMISGNFRSLARARLQLPFHPFFLTGCPPLERRSKPRRPVASSSGASGGERHHRGVCIEARLTPTTPYARSRCVAVTRRWHSVRHFPQAITPVVVLRRYSRACWCRRRPAESRRALLRTSREISTFPRAVCEVPPSAPTGAFASTSSALRAHVVLTKLRG